MRKIPKVCLTCGRTQTDGSRCAQCETKHQTRRTKAKHRPHYDYAYRKAAAIVRANAITCWICGGTKREDDPWTADHLVPADPNSPLLPAHRSCNSRRGNTPPPTPPTTPT